MSAEHLFVYGTLRRDADGPSGELLGEVATFLGAASCQGRLYRAGQYPAMIVSPLKRDRVRGELFRLKMPGKTLARLDHYEGCGSGYKQPTEFVRRLIRILPDDGKALMGWAYVYNHPVHNLMRIAGGDYLSVSRKSSPLR